MKRRRQDVERSIVGVLQTIDIRKSEEKRCYPFGPKAVKVGEFELRYGKPANNRNLLESICGVVAVVSSDRGTENIKGQSRRPWFEIESFLRECGTDSCLKPLQRREQQE